MKVLSALLTLAEELLSGGARERPAVASGFPLGAAYFCSSCDWINEGCGRCRGCGRRADWPVANWLDREPPGA